MRAAVLAALLVLGGCARPVEPARPSAPSAPPKPKVTLTLSLKPIARMWFRVGMAHLRDGDFEAGIDALKHAYELLPHPNVAYNIGRAYAECGALKDAIVWYRVYLASKPPDAEEVERVIMSLQRRWERRL